MPGARAVPDSSARAAAAAVPPPAPTWCRLGVQLAMVSPTPGRILSIERGPRTWRLTVCCPRPVLVAAGMALLGNQPWVWELVRWIRAVLAGHY